jgi:hypothetical protein
MIVIANPMLPDVAERLVAELQDAIVGARNNAHKAR